MSVLPTSIGPPAVDMFARDANVPAVDGLMRQSLKSIQQIAPKRPEDFFYTGLMNYDHVALVGPPGRLQGGYHGPARLMTVLDAIDQHTGNSYPFAYSVRIGAAIRLFEEVPFEATYNSSESGWWLTTRFNGTDKLSGAAWSIAKDHPAIAPEQLSRWRERWNKEKNNPDLVAQQILTVKHYGTDKLFWTEFNLPDLIQEFPGFTRFSEDGKHVSLGFLTFNLDNLLIISQAIQLKNPMFTTQIGMAFSQQKIPIDKELIMIADRENVKASDISTAKPVELHGNLEGSRIVNAIVTDRDFSTVYAQGWATGHPINMELMMKSRNKS